MNRRIFPITLVVCLILYSLTVPCGKSQNEPFDFILIKQDGNVEPSFAPIQQLGNVYTLTENINKPIVVERGNITINGAGHWLQRSNNAPNITGIDSGVGINLTCSYVTVRNVYISNWNTGILGVYDNNEITNNYITRCYMGVKIYGNNYTVDWNYIANNQFKGIQLRANHTVISHNEIAGEQDGIDISYADHIIMENNMSNTGYDITGLGTGNVFIFRNNFFKTSPNRYLLPGVGAGDAIWESGGEGNYWKAYNGTDENGDGIGDTPYSIGQVFASGSRIWDVDYHPLMKPVTVQKPPEPSPTPNSTPTLAPPQQTPSPNLTPLPSPTVSPSATPTLLLTAPPTLSPSPTIPEYPAWIILPLAVVMALMTAIIVRGEKQKQSSG